MNYDNTTLGDRLAALSREELEDVIRTLHAMFEPGGCSGHLTMDPYDVSHTVFTLFDGHSLFGEKETP